jgi:hypothetical protein
LFGGSYIYTSNSFLLAIFLVFCVINTVTIYKRWISFTKISKIHLKISIINQKIQILRQNP